MKTLINKKIKLHKKILLNFFWRSLQTVGKEGVLFFIFFITARFLNPYDFGIYNYILAVAFFLVIFGKFGISSATFKYVAEYNATNKDKLKLVLFNSSILIFSVSSIVILLTIIFGKYFLRENYVNVLYALPLVMLAPLSSLYDGAYRGLKRFKQLALISLSTGTISIIAAYFLINNYGLVGALFAQNFLYFLLLLGEFLGYGKIVLKLEKKLMKNIGKYSLLIGITSLAYFLYTRADIFILKQFGYINEIGYFEIINRAFTFLVFPIGILAQVIAPNIASFYARKEYTIILKKLKKYFIILLPSGILIAIIFYFIFPILIKLFLKEYYTNETILIFTILIYVFPSKFLNLFMSQSFMISTESVKWGVYLIFITGALNIILDYWFISLIGFTGVFWATLIVSNINILAQSIIVYKRIKLKSIASLI
jgi:O-antigen/teichoic acid export membrane protein